MRLSQPSLLAFSDRRRCRSHVAGEGWRRGRVWVSSSEIPARDGSLHVPHDAHAGYCGRLGAGSVFTVYRSRQSYEASAKFTTWLYRIATNLAINHARDTKNERPENTVSVDAKNEETGQSLMCRTDR